MAKFYSTERSVNYDSPKQKEPKKRMGEMDHANLPNRPMYMSFSSKHDYRDGLINSFTCSVEEISGIAENEK